MAEESGFQIEGTAAEHYEAQVVRFMGPLVQRLVDAVVSSGDAVLDVACGTGFASRSAAAVVGVAGRVVGVDINPGMLAMARSVPDPSTLEIAWREASALELPFADGEFDTVICSQGVQFFPQPDAGLAEMRRVVRAGGTVAATVWGPRPEIPYLQAQAEMLVRFCGTDPAALEVPFREEDQIAGWFASAGFEEVSVDLIEVVVSLPPVREYLPEWLKALPWSASFFELDAGARDEALAFVENEMVGYGAEAGTEVPFRTFLATATAPA